MPPLFAKQVVLKLIRREKSLGPLLLLALALQKKFPLTNELLINAKYIDVPNRIKSIWNNVQYFVQYLINPRK